MEHRITERPWQIVASVIMGPLHRTTHMSNKRDVVVIGGGRTSDMNVCVPSQPTCYVVTPPTSVYS